MSDVGSSKPVKPALNSYTDNIEKLKKYGASHLGGDVAREEG